MTFLRFEALPTGVWPIRDYRSLGATLVECEHDERHQRPTRGWVAVTADDIRNLGGLGLCAAEARALLHEGEHLDYDGVLLCSVCRADEMATASFSRPVKMLAIVPAADLQAALF